MVSEGTPKKVWELADDEAMTLVSGKNRLIQLPPEESPMAIFDQVLAKYPDATAAPAALYAKAFYYQQRQQFPEAIETYQRLQEKYPNSQEAKNGKDEIAQIKLPGLTLEQTPLFTAAAPPRAKSPTGNLSEVTFTIRKYKLESAVRDGVTDRNWDRYGQFCNLSYLLNQGDDSWKRYLGEKVSTWKQPVATNEKNLTAEAEVDTKLTEPGVYVLTGRAEDPRKTLPCSSRFPALRW